MRCFHLILFAAFTLLTTESLTAELPKEVDVIFSAHCFTCHGKKKQLGKLDLRTLESIREGGKRGPALVGSNVEASRIVQLVQPGAKPHMPPGKKKQLSDADIATLADWIHGLPAEERPHDGDLTQQDGREDTAPRSGDETDAAKQPEVETVAAYADPTSAINSLVADRYKRLGVTPAEPCSDVTFVRRIYLDLLGRVPTITESHGFLESEDSTTEKQNRDQLIERLVASDEFPRHWAKLFDAMLMGRKETKLPDRKRHGWHSYLEAVFRDHKPWDEVAHEVLLARGGAHGDPKQRGHLWFLYERENKHQDLAEAIARGFFGVDIACAQCHDHPIAGEIEQAHYWGLVAFFKRSTNSNSDNGIAMAESAIGGFDSYANALTGSTDDSILTFLDRQTVAEARPEKPDKQEDKDEFYVAVEQEPRVPKFSRRQKFVDEILKDHPLLARAMVNRVWAILMGRGLVHPIDKMDSQHPASHPKLLDWLALDFATNGYDVPRLVDAITKSVAYQLDSRRPTNENGNPVEPATFAYGLEKPLSAESTFVALRTALQLSNEEMGDGKVAKEFRKLFPDVVPENQLTTLKQTMMLSNHPELREIYLLAARKLVNDHFVLDDQCIQDLYERVYVRRADEDELQAVRNYLTPRKLRLEEALSDVLWAMTTSAEFRFNH